MDRQETYVGIDVAKAGMDVAARPSNERWVISNDETGIRQLVSRLKTLEPAIVVLEASVEAVWAISRTAKTDTRQII